MPADLRFRAMGTWAHVVVVDGPGGALGHARARIDELERRWSRFLCDSEVSRLNAAGDGPVVVSPDTALLVGRALEAWHLTAGAFDPTILPDLVAAGYDRSFELLHPAPATFPRHWVSETPIARKSPAVEPQKPWAQVDPMVRVVTLAPGVAFDPGGIGKGLAADVVVAELMAAGAAGACVNLGGDLRAEGTPPEGPPWVVDIDDPFAPADKPPITRLGFDQGAVATSSRLRRAWDSEGGPRHHLIDPTTGRPSACDAVAATVLAGEAWRAEGLATALMITGVEKGLRLLATSGATGLIVDRLGHVHHAAGLTPYLG